MRRLGVLCWKECLEVRWLAYAGLLVFLLPAFREASNLSSYAERGMSLGYVREFVALSAGVLAMLVAVTVTCSDLRSGLHAFWMSRPVSLAQSLAIKWLAGLAVVVVVCAVALGCEVVMSWAMLERPDVLRHAIDQSLTFTLAHSPAIVLIYSLSFLLGCLFRRTVHAAIFSLAALLLVYFAPLLIPMLGWLSVSESAQVVDHLVRLLQRESGHFLVQTLISRHAWFLAAMFGSSALATALAWVAIARNWRLRLDVKLLCWTLGGVAILLFAATAWQVGSNLKCERLTRLNDLHRAVYCADMDGQRGVVATYEIADPRRIEAAYNLYLQRFDMRQQNNVMVPGEVFTSHGPIFDRPFADPGQSGFVWSADRPNYVHFIEEKFVRDSLGNRERRTELYLCTARFDGGDPTRRVHRLDLMPLVPDPERPHVVFEPILEGETVFLINARREQAAGQSRSYRIAGWQAVVIDVSEPEAPKVARVAELPNFGGRRGGWGGDGGGFRVGLPELSEMSRSKRLEWAVRYSQCRLSAIEGELLVTVMRGALETYRRDNLTDTEANFTRVGQRLDTPLERLIGAYPQQMFLRDGLVYVLQSGDAGGLTVFDVRDPANPKRVGHYAAPDDRLMAIAPLPNGRTLVAGRSLHVVGPPRLD